MKRQISKQDYDNLNLILAGKRIAGDIINDLAKRILNLNGCNSCSGEIRESKGRLHDYWKVHKSNYEYE